MHRFKRFGEFTWIIFVLLANNGFHTRIVTTFNHQHTHTQTDFDKYSVFNTHTNAHTDQHKHISARAHLCVRSILSPHEFN